MPTAARQALDRIADRLRPQALIVATDPLSHRPYVLWALGRGMDVLLDKPITTRRGAVSDPAADRPANSLPDLTANFLKVPQPERPIDSAGD
jgi:hypothetical protein